MDSLKHYRQTPEVYFEKPEQEPIVEERKEDEAKQRVEICPMVDEEEEKKALIKTEPVHVTQDEVNQFVERYYPGNAMNNEIQNQSEEKSQLNQNWF